MMQHPALSSQQVDNVEDGAHNMAQFQKWVNADNAVMCVCCAAQPLPYEAGHTVRTHSM